jgi:hypothetical protein
VLPPHSWPTLASCNFPPDFNVDKPSLPPSLYPHVLPGCIHMGLEYLDFLFTSDYDSK